MVQINFFHSFVSNAKGAKKENEKYGKKQFHCLAVFEIYGIVNELDEQQLKNVQLPKDARL